MRLDSGSIQAVSSAGLRDVPDTAVNPAVGACFAGDSNHTDKTRSRRPMEKISRDE
jgi:hypothetical protein